MSYDKRKKMPRTDDEDVGVPPTPRNGRPPKEDGDGKPDLIINFKGLKFLPKSAASITPKVDPYTEQNPPDEPYALINRFNPIVGGTYLGEDNLSGGLEQQFLNAANSGFLQAFDSVRMTIALRYLYMPMQTGDTSCSQLIDEMRRSISDTLSTASATTFTNQQIYDYVVVTSMPMGSAKTYDDKATTVFGSNYVLPAGSHLYMDTVDVLYAFLMFYQITLQQVANVFNNFNKFRLNFGNAIRMSWNRETSSIKSLIGLLKKKSFLALWNAIAATIEGEFVDTHWMEQATMMQSICSRRSDSMTDPMLEISAIHEQADYFLAAYYPSSASDVGATPIIGSENMQFTPAGATSPVTFYEACDSIMEYCSLNKVLTWARSKSPTKMYDNAYFNAIKQATDVIIGVMDKFKPGCADLRNIFDILIRVKVVNWERGVKLKVMRQTDTFNVQNKTVDNIFEMVLGGADSIKYNADTMRWVSYALWDMYSGIPDYDTKSGGAFISFSTKHLIVPSGTSAADTNYGWMPIAFDRTKSKAVASTAENPLYWYATAVNRMGDVIHIGYNVVTPGQNSTLARLVPLMQMANIQTRVPVVLDYDKAGLGTFVDVSNSLKTKVDAMTVSHINKLLLEITHSSYIDGDTQLDPDILTYIPFEIEDITNEAIAYAKTAGPFRTTVTNPSILGFYGVADRNEYQKRRKDDEKNMNPQI